MKFNKKLIKEIFKEILTILLIGAFFLYGFVSFYYNNTYCELEINNIISKEQGGLYKDFYSGSIRSIEEKLNLQRGFLGLHADYKNVKDLDVIRFDCDLKIKW